MAGLVVTGRMRTRRPRAVPRPPPPSSQAAGARPDGRVAAALAPVGAPDFTRIAGQSVKGVANISSLQVVRTPNSPFGNDPFLRYFFGDGDEVFGSRDRRSLSLGSGVLISADGYVITNNHVVGENVREITVALSDKREIKGRVIGVDPSTDIALLKIDVRGVPAVPWGDSSQLKIGEWVLAIGSPYQLNQTVTAGIISATGRAGLGFADYEDFIQTDAAINRGQLGRRADQRPRRAHRHQHRHLQRERRLPGHRLRRAEQPGEADRHRSDEERRGAARIDRTAHPRKADRAAGRRRRRAQHRTAR